jgi:hypothetical protein
VRQPQVDAVAAPFEVDCIRDYARTHWVQVYISDKFLQPTVGIDQQGFIAPLKYMPDARVAPIKVAGVAKTQVVHDL